MDNPKTHQYVQKVLFIRLDNYTIVLNTGRACLEPLRGKKPHTKRSQVYLCFLPPLRVSSAGVGLERRCMLSLSSEKSFHRCTLLSLPTLPPVQTSITIRVGYTTVAWTSHKTCGGEEADPADREVKGHTVSMTLNRECVHFFSPLALSVW